MDITNKRLKSYINNNTTAIIRDRANACSVLEMSLSEDLNTINATVNGSSGIPYHVSFTNILQGEISSTCSCPYDHSSVCKHKVALALESEAFFSIKDQSTEIAELVDLDDDFSLLPAPKKTEKYSSKDPYSIPIEHVYNYTMDHVIKLHSSNQLYKTYSRLYLQIEIDNVSDNHINFSVQESEYWSGDYVFVVLYKSKTDVSLLCNCKNSNKNLCKHQVKALDFISNNMPLFLASKEKIESLKENLLNAYGFSVKDNTYKSYFDFQYINGKLEAVPKVPGILKSYDNEDLSTFSDNLLDTKNIIASQLPVTIKTKPKTFALLFAPSDQGLGFYPVIGNTDNLKSRLTSKIEPLNSEAYIAKKHLFSKKEQLILESIFKLEHFESKDQNEIYKFQFQTIKSIINTIDDTVLIGRLINTYQKIAPRIIEPIFISKNNPVLSFKLTEETHFYLLKAYIKLESKKVALKTGTYVKDIFCICQKNTYYFYKSLYEAKAFIKFNETPEIRIHKADFEAYNNGLIQPLAKQFEVIVSKRKYKKQKAEVTAFKKQIYCLEEEDIIVLQLALEYNNEQYELLKNDFIEYEKDGKYIKVDRQLDFEEDFYETVANTHPEFKNQDQEGFFFLSVEDFVKNGWFLDAFETFKNNDIEVFGSEKLTKLKYNTNKPSITTSINSNIDWFDVNIEIKFGDQHVSLRDIRKSIIKKDNFIKLKDGSIGILPEHWVNKYSTVFRSGDVKKDNIKVSKYQLSLIDTLYDEIDVTSEIARNHKKIKEGLKSFKNIESITKPRGVKATLRSYQKEGLNWLNFLETYNFGGCLADDMGLGKTLQIISFLKHIKNTKKPNSASLIVLPTSLIFNWQEEVTKFAPSLKYLTHTGIKRETNTDAFDSVDIIFSTYGIVMRDIPFLKNHQFNYCILDESQAIKNPNSKRYKSVKLINAKNRLVLTGTPIENNTFDLYAQMSFVNPGLLGTMSNFKNEFSTPIDKNKDPEVAEALRRMINPFLMRRTKAQVATELPEKTEQILYCTMEKEQQKLYDAYKNKYKDYLLNKIDENGIGKSKMYVLEGLTKLRQICDAPQLLNDQEKYTTESVKIKELLKHVTEQTGKHKILIFSQFVKMLSLIKNAFDKETIQYEYLDGKTKDRQAKVDNFQNNDDIRVFLISLKAGGTGLNLTAADYVYIVDPWWNPAVEAQAIDRCYRIGQNKKVMAYKMICTNTIEEKIMKYQETKKQLSNDIIQTDESFVKNLSKESITDLFS